MKRIRQFFKGATLVYFCCAIATFLCFDILWCAQTTFRALGLWYVWVMAILASLAVTTVFAVSGKRWFGLLLMLAVDFGLMANLMYCRTYFRSIPLDSYGMAGNLRDFIPSVIDSVSPADFILPVIAVACYVVLKRFMPVTRIQKLGGVRLLLAFGTLFALLICFTGGFRNIYRNLKQSCYYSTCTTPAFTPVGDLLFELLDTPTTLTDTDAEFIRSWLAFQEDSLTHPVLPDGVMPRRSVVVVVCESLESWPMEKVVDGVEITPYINSLIADSSTLYCPNVVTQVANGRSIDFQLMLNAGMLPMKNEVYSMTRSDVYYPTLNREIAQRGGRSLLLTCDKPVTWNQLPIAKAFGYDSLLHKSSWRNDELVGNPPKLSDGSFIKQITGRLSQGELWPVDEPIMLTVITYSGHNPFKLPEGLKSVSFGKDLPEKMRDYMEMANYTDKSLRPLVEYLKSRPDYDSTLVVITGDHEGLAKSRSSIRANSRAAGIVSDCQLTPLIILNSPLPGRYDNIMGQIDIYPTLKQLLGYRNGWNGMGQSIFAPDKAAVAIVSMTGELIGDTTEVSPGRMTHIRQTRTVSDLMISFDYLRQTGQTSK